MYSAVKVNGKRLYDMARKGITVERKPRRITIYALEIEKVELPLVTMRIRCSKGTYIRTLCEDLGNALGTGAAMQSLIRTRVGQFTLDQARTLDELEHLAKTKPEELLPLIRPVDSFFADIPAAACTPDALRLLKNGNVLTLQQLHFLSAEEDPQREYRTADTFDTSSLPGIDPGEKVIRIYDADGFFYGLYRTRSGAKGRGLYSAYKMFLPEK
jgi:tRNA pseudouridine55 synthase